MQSTSSNNIELVVHTLRQMVDACNMVMTWNRRTASVDDYLSSPEGMQCMAASCMLIQSIGEGVKKIDKLLPGFLEREEPSIPWKSLKGMRDHIAHGYFNIDSEIVFDVAVNEIVRIAEALKRAENSL